MSEFFLFISIFNDFSGIFKLLGHLLLIAKELAAKHNIGRHFRLVINNGTEAGQSIFHLHLHVMGGRKMLWPPG